MERFFIGVDPGFTGAVACYCPEARTLIVEDMPVIKDPSSGRPIVNHPVLYAMLRPTIQNVSAMVEKVHAMPNQSAQSGFRFGEGFGALQMALFAHEIPTHFVSPAAWKKYFRLSKDKGASRGLATQRFPANADQFKRVKDDGRAEAALIALYAAETAK